jgi:leucyl aminopeptidase
MKAVSELKPSGIKVVGITPLTDNSPSGSATKPGDIIKGKNGKTVEIINTDAEGRLILADALTYAERYKPDFVVDLATLTGAVTIALGEVYAAAYFNSKVDESTRKNLLDSGDFTGDNLWYMPLDKRYREQIKSKHADIKNVGGKLAGSITAAMFLAEFAEKYPWSHLDIAGVAFGDKAKGYTTSGASGFGVRLLVEFLRKKTS